MREKRNGTVGGGMNMVISRGAALASRREAAARIKFSLDITVQFSGIEMIDWRQRLHT